MRWWFGTAALWLGLCSLVRAEPPRLLVDEIALTDGATSWNGKARWAPGETVHVRVVVSGVRRDEDGRIRLRESLELLDADGKLLLEAPDLLSVEQQLDAEPSDLEFVNQFQIPVGLAAGQYAVRVRCEDLLAADEADAELPFLVGSDAAPVEFRLERFSIEAISATPGAAPGSGARAEARLAGYAMDEQGRYWIEADLLLLDASGRVALRWDRVLERHERSEPRGLPLKLSLELELPEPAEPGLWQIELRVRDRLAAREAVHRATWTKR